MCPAKLACESRFQSRQSHANSWASAPTNKALSTPRPVMTICAPWRNASAMPRAPKYALALNTFSGSGFPENISVTPSRRDSGSNASTSSPVTIAMLMSIPRARASACNASRHAAGLSPPAFDKTFTPRAAIAGKFSAIVTLTKSVA